MEQKTFKIKPDQLSRKTDELTVNGWEIISTVDTSTPPTEPDAHGVSYGGSEITIIAKRR